MESACIHPQYVLKTIINNGMSYQEPTLLDLTLTQHQEIWNFQRLQRKQSEFEEVFFLKICYLQQRLFIWGYEDIYLITCATGYSENKSQLYYT